MATVVITGANRGIGLAFAQAYAQRGDHVIGTARNVGGATELAALDVQVEALDVADEDSTVTFGERLAGMAVDLLINNAGILHREGLQDATSESLRRQFEVNALGPFRVTRALLPSLRRAAAPRIVHMTSRMGSIDDNTSGAMYGYRSSKAALNMIAKSMSIDLAPIPVVVLHPGAVTTSMTLGYGDISADDAVARMLKIIDRLDASMTGRFYHRDDYELPW